MSVSVKRQTEPMWKASSATARLPTLPTLPTPACEPLSVRFQGGPPGRSRRRRGAHAYAPADAPAAAAPNAGRLARKHETLGPPFGYNSYRDSAAGCPCPRCGIVQGRAEPVKAVCGRRTTAPVNLPGERTREDDLDRTCPAKEVAAIGSMGTSGQNV
jgi:hypothetical protein